MFGRRRERELGQSVPDKPTYYVNVKFDPTRDVWVCEARQRYYTQDAYYNVTWREEYWPATEIARVFGLDVEDITYTTPSEDEAREVAEAILVIIERRKLFLASKKEFNVE